MRGRVVGLIPSIMGSTWQDKPFSKQVHNKTKQPHNIFSTKTSKRDNNSNTFVDSNECINT